MLPPVVEKKEGESQQVKGNNSDEVEADINVGPGKVLHHIGVVLSVALVDTDVKVVWFHLMVWAVEILVKVRG